MSRIMPKMYDKVIYPVSTISHRVGLIDIVRRMINVDINMSRRNIQLPK